MPKVTFANTGQTVEFESGKLPYDEHGKPEVTDTDGLFDELREAYQETIAALPEEG